MANRILGEWELLGKSRKGVVAVRCTICGLETTRRANSARLAEKKCHTGESLVGGRACAAMADGRLFPLVTMPCTVCGKPTSIRSNNAHLGAKCSLECRREASRVQAAGARKRSPSSLLQALLTQCKFRAKKRGMEFDLTFDWANTKLEEQGGKCAISGVEMIASNAPAKSRSHKFTATIDRIDSTKGYTKDNVQLVTYIANICKNAFTMEDVMEFAVNVVRTNSLVVGTEGTCL